MSTVRFATVCDSCARRSEEYTSWPMCRECGIDVCPSCYVDGSKTEADLHAPETAYCQTCFETHGAEVTA